MKPFITTEYTELQSNLGALNKTDPVQSYSLHYLDQNWRFINDKSMVYTHLSPFLRVLPIITFIVPRVKLKDSNHIRNEVAEVEKLTIDERILELEESSLVE